MEFCDPFLWNCTGHVSQLLGPNIAVGVFIVLGVIDVVVKLIIKLCQSLEAGGEHEGDDVGHDEEDEDEQDLV